MGARRAATGLAVVPALLSRTYHGVQIHIESSSSIDDRTIHRRCLELQGIHIHAVDSRMLQWLGRLLSVQIELLLERI